MVCGVLNYGDFFMGKIMKTGQNRWLNVVIWVFSATVIIIVGLLIWNWRNLLETEASELLRLLTFCIGGIGAAIGLKIAIERQDKFSEQVQVQIDQVQVQVDQMRVQADQSFNDRLGRGVELLADEKNVVMRSAGVRVLVDLANNASKEQKSLIVSIIYDFFRDKASIRRDENRKRIPILVTEKRQDVQNALDFLISVPANERKNLYQNWLYEDQLDFRGLDFSYLGFSDSILEKINFSGSHFFWTKFDNMNIENIISFGAVIEATDFDKVKFKKVSFFGTCIDQSYFFQVQIIDSIFEIKNEINVSSKDSLPYFISTDLGLTIFDFDDKIEPSDFFELCYYGAKQKSLKMDDSRRYYLREDRVKVFVKSDKKWSGDPVDEWVNLERVTREQERNDEEAHWMRQAEEAAENMPEQEYQQPPHPIEEAQQLLERGREREKRLKEKQKKPKPKAKKPKPNPKTLK